MVLKSVIILIFFTITSTLSNPLDLTEDSLKVYENSSSVIQHAPWHVSIRINGIHFCSGAIIGSDWVVTSAQCVISCTSGSSRVITIQTSPSTNFTISGSVHNIMTSIVHESYTTSCTLPVNDIGLLRISDYFNFSSPHAPKIIKVNSLYTASPDTEVNVTNWNQGFVDNKISVNVNLSRWAILSNQQCLQYYYSIVSLGRNQFCGVNRESNVENPCAIGDTGDPVVLNGELIGIKSYKMNCNILPQAASLFTNVGYYYSWIKGKIGSSWSKSKNITVEN